MTFFINLLRLIPVVLLLAQPVILIFIAIALIIKGVSSKEVWYWYFKTTWYFILGIPVTILGLPIVALGILFKREIPGTTIPFKDPRYVQNGNHSMVRLPDWKWIKPWDNLFDGLLGDKRGWWDNYCRENYNKTCRSFYSMWQWAAIRNPANYYSRVITGCDISKCDLKVLAGQPLANEDNPGWSFLVATDRETGKKFHEFQFCFPYKNKPTKALYGKFGWKIKMSHAGTPVDADEKERIKGSVYRLSPYKDIS